ncbi:porin family protein [Leyella lascolaii]|uniref:Porin family protein n=1 Tax=Leyella lascolaii TaxID=1776379 RepID=A0AAW7JJN3_9BACT|nr:porin family protein [Leyella lascolaii]MDN0023495.1 porin family protein [Leyella lascolaii]MDN0025667.1 porin family protein [Leyella lascolaii]
MRKVIIMAVLMLSSVAAFAQRPVGSLTVQPKIGMNFATLTKADDSESRIGLVAGAELEYQLSDIFSISGGALYSQQGCEWSEDGSTRTNKLDYINIPILANVYVVKNLAVKVGLQPAFNVNSKQKASKGDASVQGSIEGTKTFDCAIPVGLSYEYKNFVIDGRYNFGLTKVSKYADSKNSVFQLTLGYKLDI